MADEPAKPLRLSGAIKWIALTIAGALIAELTLDVSGWFRNQVSPEQPVSIDFQEALGCPAGRLWDIAGDFGTGISLENGADSLVICHDARLTAPPSNLPRKLAIRFPACLDYRNGKLSLMRNSSAVCALPGEDRFICIGKQAQDEGDATLGRGHMPPPCSPDILQVYGF